MSDVFGESAGLDAESGSERPLSDEERAAVARLLSDPFAFPMQFKTWLISFLEGSDILLPRSSVQGLSSLLGSGGGQGVLGLLPAGLIFPYGGASAPIGALLCNGASYSVAGYQRLFDAIGYGFGGSGANFNVPDLRRRLPWGTGASVPIGSSDGRAEANRHVKHNHFFQDTRTPSGSVSGSISGGGHEHSYLHHGDLAFQEGINASLLASDGNDFGATTSGGGGHSHGFSGSFSGSPMTVSGSTSGGFDQDQPAFLVVGFIINY